MSETHPDYGRDEDGRYTGNPQRHPEHELRGETQESVGKWLVENMGPGDDPVFQVAQTMSAVAKFAVSVNAPRDEVVEAFDVAFLRYSASHDRQIADGRLPDGYPAALGFVLLNVYSAAHRMRVDDVHREASKLMAKYRRKTEPGPFAHAAEWSKDADAFADARKGADDAPST